MSDQPNSPVIKPFWRRGLAGLLDFMTVFFVAGYIISAISGETTSQGFNLTGPPALILLAVIILYFYLGWKKLGGTLWQRILKAR
jgi:RDD family